MACFIVPFVEAAATTVITKVVEKKEKNEDIHETSKIKTNFSRKLKWLNSMLWGGSALLAFEHLWHGEIVPWFPFLTNAINPTDRVEMFSEIATVGIGMAVLVTAIWSIIVIVSNIIEKRMEKLLPIKQEE